MEIKNKRTRRLNDQQLSRRLNDGCPRCGGRLASKARMVTSELTGLRKFAGSFMGCSSFPSCDYYVNLDGIESVRDGDRDPPAS